MLKYKVDWLAFSIALEKWETLDDRLLTALGYELGDFEEAPGRFFYNSGATLGNYVNVYWNDPSRKLHRNSSKSQTLVFTGQGATDLALRWDSDWLAIFQMLTDYGGVNFTRIDLALDDYDETVKFADIEKKLRKGHYRSSKRSYNIVRTSDALGRVLGETIYIGNARSDNGSRGNVYARFYDKRAQYLAKNELFPSEVVKHWEQTGKETWQRYEISFSKKYAGKVIDQFLEGNKVDKIFKTSLRNLLELLTPRPGDTNKSRWYKARFWEDFLAYDDTMDFGLPERDVMLGDLLEWLRVSVLPSFGLLEEIGEERGFDIYELFRQAPKPAEYSKKQKRLLANSQSLEDDTIKEYLKKYLK